MASNSIYKKDINFYSIYDQFSPRMKLQAVTAFKHNRILIF